MAVIYLASFQRVDDILRLRPSRFVWPGPFGNGAESARPVSRFQTNSRARRLMALTGLALNDGLIARTLLHADTASLRWPQTN